MDAPSAIRRESGPAILSNPSPGLIRAAAVAGFALLALGGMFLASRRATGALAEPLPVAVLLGCAGALSLSALAFRRKLGSFKDAAVGRFAESASWAAPSVVLVLWALGLSAGASAAALVGLWGVLLLEEAWSWHQFLRVPRAVVTVRVATASPARLAGDPHAKNPAASVGLLEVGQEETFDETVSQQIVRRFEEDGRQTISGWVRAEVAAGCRHATAHVAVCPPLARVPECFAEPLDGPPALVKVAQVLTHGVRFEIKLDQPAAETASVIVEFSIQERAAAP